MKHLLDRRELIPGEAQVEQRWRLRRLEDAEHDLFAVLRRQRRDAQVDDAVARARLDPSVLRHPLLRDIHVREHLDTREQRRLHPVWEHQIVAQHAVNPQPDAHALGIGLDMHVAGAEPGRGEENLMADRHDGRHVGGLRRFVRVEIQPFVAAREGNERGTGGHMGGGDTPRVVTVDAVENFAAAGDHRQHTAVRRELHGIDGRHELPEKILSHFRGYANSTPVRIGNAAYNQLQLDIHGVRRAAR